MTVVGNVEKVFVEKKQKKTTRCEILKWPKAYDIVPAAEINKPLLYKFP